MLAIYIEQSLIGNLTGSLLPMRSPLYPAATAPFDSVPPHSISLFFLFLPSSDNEIYRINNGSDGALAVDG